MLGVRRMPRAVSMWQVQRHQFQQAASATRGGGGALWGTGRFTSALDTRALGGAKSLVGCSGWAGRLGASGAGSGSKSMFANVHNPRVLRSITSSIAGATATTRKLGVETGARYSSITTNVGSKHPAAISTVRSATRKLSSYLRVARGSEDENTTLYALMALHVLGTGLWVYNDMNGGTYTRLLEENLCVPLRESGKKIGFKLHTLVTANFSSRSVIEGALATAVLYFVGSTATAVVGPRFLLAAFLGGGVFAQLCQAVGPILSLKAKLPSVFYLGAIMPSCGPWPGIEALLAWYILTFPSSQINLFFALPVPTYVVGVVWVGGMLFTMSTNGQMQVPFISSNPYTLWRDLGAVTAGAFLWLALARRPYMFRKRF